MPANRIYPTLKPLMDRCVAGLAMITLAPAYGLIAALVALDDGFPVLFRQQRIGLDGRSFEILKFRTLTGGSPTHRPGSFETRIGGFLRRTGLDELPQLANVLAGHMSLVGPRPTLPEQVVRYGDRERRRLRVRPGLTGWAQIHGRNAIDWERRIELDLWYVDHVTLLVDLQILLRTPRVLLSGRGLYGEGGENPDYSPLTRPAEEDVAS